MWAGSLGTRLSRPRECRPGSRHSSNPCRASSTSSRKVRNPWAALLVVRNLMKDEVNRLCGPSHSRPEGREQYRHGRQRGYCVIAEQKVPLKKPRVRQAKGGETELARLRAAVPGWTRLTRPAPAPRFPR